MKVRAQLRAWLQIARRIGVHTESMSLLRHEVASVGGTAFVILALEVFEANG